ncbi:hypothetical protein KR059_010185 [Drosophila kikkawai]|nr:hypothetical protein KR059_010185 [Drosophila kikkawai]
MSAVTQEFCVRWNSHLGSIGAAFPQLLAGQRFVDVTLACEGHQLQCHRLVLAACSTYFETILAEHPCKHPVIILPREIKLWEIQALVDFMYKGEVNVTQAGLGQLLRCAEQLRIRGLYGSEATINYKQLQQAQTKQEAPTLASRVDSTDAVDDAATNSTTTSTSTTTTPPVLTSKQQQQQQQIIKEARQRHHQINGTNNAQQCASSAPGLGSNSNAPTEDESADEVSNNWNAYRDHFEDYNASAGAPLANSSRTNVAYLQQPRWQQLQQQQQYMDTAIEDDHNYVAVNDVEDNDNSFTTGGTKGGGSCLSLSMTETEPHDTSLTNASMGLLSNSVDGYTSYKRVRRSEASLAQAAKCVSKGETFQTVSNMFNIPVSTIRFYMARKGILPKRKRGRGASHAGNIIITTTNSGTLAAAPAPAIVTSHHPPSQQHQQHDVSLNTMQLKAGIASTSGSNSPATAAAAAASPPSLDAASVPFHLLSNAAATFKLEQQQLHMI